MKNIKKQIEEIKRRKQEDNKEEKNHTYKVYFVADFTAPTKTAAENKAVSHFQKFVHYKTVQVDEGFYEAEDFETWLQTVGMEYDPEDFIDIDEMTMRVVYIDHQKKTYIFIARSINNDNYVHIIFVDKTELKPQFYTTLATRYINNTGKIIGFLIAKNENLSMGR